MTPACTDCITLIEHECDGTPTMTSYRTQKSSLKFLPGQPPERKRGRKVSPRWGDIASALRDHPGQRAAVAEQAKSATTASAIQTGRRAAFRPAGSFESCVRRNPDGTTWTVYARYVGTGTETTA